MARKTLLFALACATLAANPALAEAANATPPKEQAAPVQRDASIPFANQGGVLDWRADGEDAIYLEDVFGHWYKAELFSPSWDLPFVQFIGLDPGPTGNLDQFGAVYIAGRRYPFSSFTEVPDPFAKRAERARQAAPARK